MSYEKRCESIIREGARAYECGKPCTGLYCDSCLDERDGRKWFVVAKQLGDRVRALEATARRVVHTFRRYKKSDNGAAPICFGELQDAVVELDAQTKTPSQPGGADSA